MANKNNELYYEPISEGVCDVLGCSNPAKCRASISSGLRRGGRKSGRTRHQTLRPTEGRSRIPVLLS